MDLNFDGVKVLLVDDDNNFTFAMKMLLGTHGLEIESMSNPVEALEYLKGNKVNIILLDYYMPEMTGEEFLKNLRTFDKTTIVFLQTAFSEEKPELQMLETLNIQGYIDKNKEPNDIFLDIVGGIKMARLVEEVEKQKIQIAMLSYKKAVIGNLITNLVNESKDQLMQISIMNESIKTDTQKYEPENKGIKNALEKIYDLYEALNFENLQDIDVEKLKQIIEKLLNPILLLNNINFAFNINAENRRLDDISDDVYLTIKMIDILAKSGIKDITLDINKKDEDLYLKVNASRNIANLDFEEAKMFGKNIEFGDNWLEYKI